MNTAGAERRLVDGRFELLQQLGGGGMGLVWRARDNALHREVVLKEVRPADPAMAAADPDGVRELRERVLREARALARIQHPNVVVIHHIVDSPDHPHPWLVMELVSGGSLADRLAEGPLGVAETARIGRGVLSALRAAHAVGIQHRDVKPGNVLLRPDGTPVLADFGIAAVQDATALTATGALIGSPEYIAPERIRGQEGNPSSDLWSLGMLLYVAVEGHHPLRRATTLATLAAVLDEPLPPPSRAGRLGPLLVALLGKDPALRPDAEQLDRALEQAEYEPETVPLAPAAPATHPAQPVPHDRIPTGFPAPPTTGLSPAASTSRRGRVTVAAVAAGAVVLAGAGALYLNRSGADADTGAAKAPSATTGATSTVSDDLPPTTAPSSAASPAAVPGSAAAVPPAAAPSADANLLNPDGVRRTVTTLQPYLSDHKVFELTVYPEYAIAEVPTSAGPNLYDRITIRDGKITREAGGELMGDEKPIDLQQYSWDVIPGLLQRAQATLNVPQPTTRYLLIDSDMFDGTPTIKVYLADDYGTGYLETDPKGTTKRTNPRGS
ncbi:serine/threonine-protein kinase [Kitasatospora sp. NPDC018058]|uniref:serine/threonine-protein kinase n=1 Tax=Kitasatospora sp. NPDC018058 TaxID=3364025 RepID=UPI0037BFDE75